MTATDLYHSWIEKLRHIRSGENKARLQTFAWMMVGMMISRSVHLSYIAQKIPSVAQQTSIAKRLSRLLSNRALRVREWYSPIARTLLGDMVASGRDVRLIIDGTKVGGGHRLLMVALAYRRRSLPIAWTWVKGTRGHSLATTQCALFAYVRSLLPEGTNVLVLGDSEFGSVELMRHLSQWNWKYVLRQKGRNCLSKQESELWQRCDTLVQQPGQSAWLVNVQFTQRFAFPVNLLAYWQPGEEHPWLLTTNLATSQQTLNAYRRRMWIEEMFADFKRHGFDLESSHLHHFLRLSRLTLLVALLYLWCVAFGAAIIKRGLRYLVDRSDRRDLSIFRIGHDTIQRFLTNGKPLPLRLLPYFEKVYGS
jgi:Transposase DDE domain